MSEIRYYLDENMSPEIAEQLRRDGIDAISVRELGTLGDPDEDHLQRAAIMGRVLCTQDADFLRLASEPDRSLLGLLRVMPISPRLAAGCAPCDNFTRIATRNV